MPRDVAGGAAPRDVTLDIPERQILVYYEGGDPLHHRILLTHISGARWIVATPTLDVHEEDLSESEVIPLGRLTPFPGDDRDIFAFDVLTADVLASLRTQGLALAAVLGAPAPPVGTQPGTLWLYADPAFESFNTELEPGFVVRGTNVVRGSWALVEVDHSSGARVWTSAEHLRAADRSAWVAEKRVGAGRDPRLLPAAATPVQNVVVPFRIALTHQKSPSASWPRFGGPSAATEVCSAICSSGVEPMSWCSQWEVASGIQNKSGLCLEHRLLVYTLWTSVCVDGMDPGQVATIEHLCRRILQIEKAVRKSAKAPDFEGLEPYMRHLQDPGLGVDSRVFDAHVADVLKAESMWLKQTRLSQEERVATEKKRKGKKDGKGQKDGQGDDV